MLYNETNQRSNSMEHEVEVIDNLVETVVRVLTFGLGAIAFVAVGILVLTVLGSLRNTSRNSIHN